MNPALVEGARRFDRGEFFAAHEAWEAVWLTAPPGPFRDACRALVQLAAALHHACRGNLRGSVRLLDRSLARLRLVPPDLLGFDLGGVVAQAEQLRRLLDAHPGGAVTPREWPRFFPPGS